MARYTRTPVSTLQGINNELAKVELAMEDTLDRKGATPNYMDANLDMNSRRILNLPAPLTDQEPLRKGDLPSGTSVSSQYVDDSIAGLDFVYTRTVQDVQALTSLDVSTESLGLVFEVQEYNAGTGLGRGRWEVVTGETANGIDILDSTASGIQYKLIPSTPLRLEEFGVSGSNDDAAFKRGLEVANGAAATCAVKASFSDTVLIENDVNLEFLGENSGIDGTSMPDAVTLGGQVALSIKGSLGTPVSVTSDVLSYKEVTPSQPYSTITITGASGLFSEGDIVLLKSNQLFDDNWSGSTNSKRGELLKIDSIDGDEITLSDNIYFSYDSTQSITLTKVNTVSVSIKGGELLMGGVGSGHTACVVTYGEDIKLETSCTKAESTAFGILTCYGGKLNVDVKESTSPSSLGNSGYGVSLSVGTRNVEVNGTFYKCRHAVSGGGDLPAIFNVVKGHAVNCGIGTNAWDCHEPCFEWVFDVTSRGGGGGIVCRGSAIDISIESTGGTNLGVRLRTFGVTTSQRDVYIRKAVIKDHRSYAFGLFDSDSPYVNLRAGTLYSENTRLDALVFAGDADGLNIEDITINGTFLNDGESSSGGRGLRLVGVDNVYINKATIHNTDKSSVSISSCQHVTIDALYASDTGGSLTPVDITSSSYIKINGGTLSPISSDFAAIQTNSCQHVTVANTNMIGDNTKASQDGWRGTDSTNCKMYNCTVVAGRHAAFFDGTSEYLSFVGNDASGVDDPVAFDTSSAVEVIDVANLTTPVPPPAP